MTTTELARVVDETGQIRLVPVNGVLQLRVTVTPPDEWVDWLRTEYGGVLRHKRLRFVGAAAERVLDDVYVELEYRADAAGLALRFRRTKGGRGERVPTSVRGLRARLQAQITRVDDAATAAVREERAYA